MLGLNLLPTFVGGLPAPPRNGEALRYLTPEMRRAMARELLNKQRDQLRRLVRLLYGDRRESDDQNGEDDSDRQPDQVLLDEETGRRAAGQLARVARMLYLLEELLAMQDYTFSRIGTFSKG
jgi:hypothetical protein